MAKRVISLVLVIATVFSVLPALALGVNAGSAGNKVTQSANYGVNLDYLRQKDAFIYFGKYNHLVRIVSNGNTMNQYAPNFDGNVAPIVWRVMGTEGLTKNTVDSEDYIVLNSEYVIDSRAFTNTNRTYEGTENIWKDSLVREFLEGNGKDQLLQSKYFEDSEVGAIATTDLSFYLDGSGTETSLGQGRFWLPGFAPYSYAELQTLMENGQAMTRDPATSTVATSAALEEKYPGYKGVRTSWSSLDAEDLDKLVDCYKLYSQGYGGLVRAHLRSSSRGTLVNTVFYYTMGISRDGYISLSGGNGDVIYRDWSVSKIASASTGEKTNAGVESGVKPLFKLDTSKIVNYEKVTETSEESSASVPYLEPDGFRLTLLDENLNLDVDNAPASIAQGSAYTVNARSTSGDIAHDLGYKIIDENGKMVDYGVLESELTAAGTYNIPTERLPKGNYTIGLWAQKTADWNSASASEPQYFTFSVTNGTPAPKFDTTSANYGVDFDALLTKGTQIYFGKFAHMTSLIMSNETGFGSPLYSDTASPVIWTVVGTERLTENKISGREYFVLNSTNVLASDVYSNSTPRNCFHFKNSNIRTWLNGTYSTQFLSSENFNEGEMSAFGVSDVKSINDGTGKVYDEASSIMYLPGITNEKWPDSAPIKVVTSDTATSDFYGTAPNWSSFGDTDCVIANDGLNPYPGDASKKGYTGLGAGMRTGLTTDRYGKEAYVPYWLGSWGWSTNNLEQGACVNIKGMYTPQMTSYSAINCGIKPLTKIDPEAIIDARLIKYSSNAETDGVSNYTAGYYKLTVLNKNFNLSATINGSSAVSGETVDVNVKSSTSDLTDKSIGYKWIDKATGKTVISGYVDADFENGEAVAAIPTAGLSEGEYDLGVWLNRANENNSDEGSVPVYATISVTGSSSLPSVDVPPVDESEIELGAYAKTNAVNFNTALVDASVWEKVEAKSFNSSNGVSGNFKFIRIDNVYYFNITVNAASNSSNDYVDIAINEDPFQPVTSAIAQTAPERYRHLRVYGNGTLSEGDAGVDAERICDYFANVTTSGTTTNYQVAVRSIYLASYFAERLNNTVELKVSAFNRSADVSVEYNNGKFKNFFTGKNEISFSESLNKNQVRPDATDVWNTGAEIAEVTMGEKIQLHIAKSPFLAKEPSFKVNYPQIASVNGIGKVTAIRAGNAKVTATFSKTINSSASLEIPVKVLPKSIVDGTPDYIGESRIDSTAYQVPDAINIDGQDLYLTFYDGFDGDAVDESKWVVEDDAPNHSGSYEAESVSVKDGSLVLTQFAETDPAIVASKAGNKWNYTTTDADGNKTVTPFMLSGTRLHSSGKFLQTYGYYEISWKINDYTLDGYPDCPDIVKTTNGVTTTRKVDYTEFGDWPGFWLLNNAVGYGDAKLDGSKGLELDICEYLPSNSKSVESILSTAHFGTTNSGGEFNCYDSLRGEYHTIGLLWTPEDYIIYLDGSPVLSLQEICDNNNTPMEICNQPLYLNITTEFAKANNNFRLDLLKDRQDGTRYLIDEVLVDYVRVYSFEKEEFHSVDSHSGDYSDTLPKIATGIYFGSDRHLVYYDRYDSNKNGIIEREYEENPTPVLWDVVGFEPTSIGGTDKTTVLSSHYALDVDVFNKDAKKSNDFIGSDLQLHLNSRENGGFLNEEYFKDGEYNAIAETDVYLYEDDSTFDLHTTATTPATKYYAGKTKVYIPGTNGLPNTTSAQHSNSPLMFGRLTGTGFIWSALGDPEAVYPSAEYNNSYDIYAMPNYYIKNYVNNEGLFKCNIWSMAKAHNTDNLSNDSAYVKAGWGGSNLFPNNQGVGLLSQNLSPIPVMKIDPEQIVFVSKIVDNTHGNPMTVQSTADMKAGNYKLTTVDENMHLDIKNSDNTELNSVCEIKEGESLKINASTTETLNSKKLVYQYLDENGRICGMDKVDLKSNDQALTLRTTALYQNLNSTSASYSLPSGTYTVRVWLERTYDVNSDSASVPASFTLNVSEASIDEFFDNADFSFSSELVNASDALTQVLTDVVNGILPEGITVTTVAVHSFTAAVDGTSKKPQGTNGSYTATVVLSDGTEKTVSDIITAKTYTEEYVVPNFTLTAQSGGNGTAKVSSVYAVGTVTDMKISVPEEKRATFSATPARHYVFDKWVDVATGKTLSADSEYTVLVRSDLSFKALFKEDVRYTASVCDGIGGNSTVTGEDGSTGSSIKIFAGDTVTFNAVPINGYKFDMWADANGKVVSRNSTYTTIMEASDLTVYAVFKADEAFVGVTGGVADTSWYVDGKGDSEENPYVIMTPEQWNGFACLVRDGNTFEGKYVTLGSNLIFNDISKFTITDDGKITDVSDPFYTMSVGSAALAAVTFKGTFDGKGHTIRGAVWNSTVNFGASGKTYYAGAGLFGNTNHAFVKNIALDTCYVMDDGNQRNAAALCAVSYGSTFYKCFVNATVEKTAYNSGLVGIAKTTSDNTDSTKIDCCEFSGYLIVTSLNSAVNAQADNKAIEITNVLVTGTVESVATSKPYVGVLATDATLLRDSISDGKIFAADETLSTVFGAARGTPTTRGNIYYTNTNFAYEYTDARNDDSAIQISDRRDPMLAYTLNTDGGAIENSGAWTFDGEYVTLVKEGYQPVSKITFRTEGAEDIVTYTDYTGTVSVLPDVGLEYCIVDENGVKINKKTVFTTDTVVNYTVQEKEFKVGLNENDSNKFFVNIDNDDKAWIIGANASIAENVDYEKAGFVVIPLESYSSNAGDGAYSIKDFDLNETKYYDMSFTKEQLAGSKEYYVSLRNFGIMNAVNGFVIFPYVIDEDGLTYGEGEYVSFYEKIKEIAPSYPKLDSIVSVCEYIFGDVLGVAEPTQIPTGSYTKLDPVHKLTNPNPDGNITVTGNLNYGSSVGGFELIADVTAPANSEAGVLVIKASDLGADCTVNDIIANEKTVKLNYTGSSTKFHLSISNFGIKTVREGFYVVGYYNNGTEIVYSEPCCLNYHNLMVDVQNSTDLTDSVKAVANSVLAAANIQL